MTKRGVNTVNKIRTFLYVFLAFGFTQLSGCKWALLDPKGIIAASEKSYLVNSTLLMLAIVVPTILLSWYIAWKFNAKNKKANYDPTWNHSTLLEVICWTIPTIIIVILAIWAWKGTHELDPYKPLEDNGKSLTIQVVALDWKWLFIYPEQRIATVNFVQFPVDTQIKFLITADAPMNSFAIPQLASQIYAMSGMQTKLHLKASEMGEYRGLSTNFSGDGFSGMHFIAKVTTQADFDKWVKTVKASPKHLTMANYNQLALPSENNPIEYFSWSENQLFENIIMKYMAPAGAEHVHEHQKHLVEQRHAKDSAQKTYIKQGYSRHEHHLAD